MAALTGLATTAFSTPCMLPLYVGTATVLSNAGLPMWQVLLYFIYYNLIFIGPLFVVLFIMVPGKDVVMMKEWSHKYERWIRGVMGLVMIFVSYLIVR
jgi:cytochrome c biogenesis protein CcdA